MADRSGQRIDHYHLIRLLGTGSFGEVYLADDMHRKSRVAIKVLPQLTDSDMVGFLNEARTIRLQHPHIVQVRDFGVDNHVPFIVMDYAPNGTLRHRHPRGTRIALSTIVPYVNQVASALQYAHDERMIHRDVKPENLLLGLANEVLVSDFGIAMIAPTSRSQSVLEMAGTVSYMAPEQIRGKPRFASDQYALAVIVFEWLSGERPFTGTPMEIATQHVFAPAPLLRDKVPGLASEVEQVILTALAKDPKDRFTRIQAFAAALEQAYREQIQWQQQQARPIVPVVSPLPLSVEKPLPSSSLLTDAKNLSLSKPSIVPKSFTRRKILLGIAALATITSGVTLVTKLSWPDNHVTSTSTANYGATKVVPDGLKNPNLLQWGADYVSGAPYVFQDPQNPSKLIGFEVEIAQAIAGLMGILQTEVEVSYPNLDQALAANQFDMVMNGWEKSSDREKTELFSDPYYRYGQQIIVRKDDTRFQGVNPTDIKIFEGMTVGTGGGYMAETIMQSDPKIRIKAYNGTLAFSDLVQKKVDAFFLDSPIASYYILGSEPGATAIPELKLLGQPLYADDYFVGFNKSNPNAAKLLPKINEAFAALKKDGTLKKIYQKWQMWNDLQAQIGIS